MWLYSVTQIVPHPQELLFLFLNEQQAFLGCTKTHWHYAVVGVVAVVVMVVVVVVCTAFATVAAVVVFGVVAAEYCLLFCWEVPLHCFEGSVLCWQCWYASLVTPFLW